MTRTNLGGPQFSIELIDRDQMTVIAHGDFSTPEPGFDARLAELVDCGFLHLTLDLAAIESIHPTIVRQLAEVAKTLRDSGGSLRLVDPTDQVAASFNGQPLAASQRRQT